MDPWGGCPPRFPPTGFIFKAVRPVRFFISQQRDWFRFLDKFAAAKALPDHDGFIQLHDSLVVVKDGLCGFP
jgi:hypothetical protein